MKSELCSASGGVSEPRGMASRKLAERHVEHWVDRCGREAVVRRHSRRLLTSQNAEEEVGVVAIFIHPTLLGHSCIVNGKPNRRLTSRSSRTSRKRSFAPWRLGRRA